MGNDGLATARNFINAARAATRARPHRDGAGATRLDEIDRAIVELKPDSWKGYTLGDRSKIRSIRGGSTTSS
jgi:hypothetical protein